MRPAQSVILMKSQHYWSEQHRQGFLGSGGRLRGSAGCGVRSGQEGSVLPTAGKLESAGGRTSCYPPSGHLEPASTACGLHHPLCANPGSAGVRRVSLCPPQIGQIRILPKTITVSLITHGKLGGITIHAGWLLVPLYKATVMRTCRRVGTNWL